MVTRSFDLHDQRSRIRGGAQTGGQSDQTSDHQKTVPHFSIMTNCAAALRQAMSGSRNRAGRPTAAVTASAARYPLRTAPSMVAGHPERVQSPARKTLGALVFASGRAASIPGRAE